MKDTVNIHGKEYETVASRVKRFWNDEAGMTIVTELIYHDAEKVIVKAMIQENGVTIASGHAEEVRASSKINKTSAVENCETSAIGRALACFGYLGSEFASADEVAGAIITQGHAQKAVNNAPDKSAVMGEVIEMIKNSGLDDEAKAGLRKKYAEVKTPEQADEFKKYVESVLIVKSAMLDGFEDDNIPWGEPEGKEIPLL